MMQAERMPDLKPESCFETHFMDRAPHGADRSPRDRRGISAGG